MWKRVLALIAVAYGTIAAGLETPILPISVNFELSETQYELRLRALNTPVVRAYLFNGTNAFDATGYDAYLAWGKNTSATNMVYVEGVTSTNGYVDFTIASNNLAYPIERWYSAVMLTYPADGKVHSVGSGYMTVLPAPEVSSTAILLKTYAINGSEYGPFTGSFSNWPFLLKDEYEGGFVEVGTYVAATSALWTTIATLATTNWVTNQGYVTASITNGFATTNWVTNQAYGLASDISDLQDATNANRVLIGTVGTNLALQSNSQAAAVGLVSTNLGLASNALTLAIGIVETDLVTASNYFDTFMGTSGSNYDAAIGLVATNLDTASNALSAAVGLVGTNLNTASNALRTAIGLVSTNLETATNQLIEATNTIFGLQSTVSVVYAWGDHADAGYLSAGTNIFDRVYAATRSALDTNIVNGSAIYTGVVSSVAYTNVVELTLGKTYAWGFTKVNANGTSTLSIGTAQLTATLAGLATNHFVCDFTDTNLVLTLSGTGDSKSNVSNMYVCAVTQGTVSAAGDLHVGGSMYLDGALYTNPAFALAELRLATNALNVRAGTLDGATNALNGRMTALDAASTGAVPVLTGRVTALDAASTGRVAVLEAATNALDGRMLALDAASTGLVAVLESATGTLNVAVSALQGQTGTWNATATYTQRVADVEAYTSRVAALESATGALNTAVGTITGQVGALQGATNALDGRMLALDAASTGAVAVLNSATNALNGRMTALDAASTGAVPVLAGRVTALDAASTGRVAVLEAATGALNTAVGSLQAATNALDVRMGEVEGATNALDNRVGDLEGGAGGTYPVFLLPVGALEGSWTDFEIKASTNNFTSDPLYWWKSWTCPPLQNDSQAIALFTDPYAGADPRTLYRRTTDVSIATHLASEDSTVEVVIFQPSHNIEGGGTWMTPANTNLVWVWIRVDEGGYEMTPDGSNYWVHPILPEQWMAAPLGQWEWAEIHTAKLAAAYAETYVTWRTNMFDGTNGVYFVNPHNGSNYWILTP